MTEQNMEAIAQKLAEIRNIIVDREGEEVADQFEVDTYIIIVNIEGSGYAEDEDVFTLIQVEKGPMGMETLLACAVESEDGESYIICGEEENLLDQLDEACNKVYRHWHWLDLPNALPGSEFEEDDDLDDDENF
jgi:flavodoxin